MTLQPETWTHELGRRVRTLLALKMLANLSGIAAFFYASLWVYVALGSLFNKDGRELAAWAAACFSMIIVGLGVFMALPTKVPDFAVDWSLYPSLQLLKRVDATGSALPALHDPREHGEGGVQRRQGIPCS